MSRQVVNHKIGDIVKWHAFRDEEPDSGLVLEVSHDSFTGATTLVLWQSTGKPAWDTSRHLGVISESR